MTATKTKSSSAQLQSTTRILLTLWELGGVESEVRRGDLTQRLKQKGQKASDYQPFFDQLEKDGAIALGKNTVSLLTSGEELLSQNLSNTDFAFTSNIGAKTANALLKWIREKDNTLGKAETNGKGKSGAIGSYEAFKPVALDVYDRLNKDYNLDNLVPIYRIRREVGDRVSRSQFDQWLVEMQSHDLWQLIGGEMPDITPDKAEDSIKTALGGVRYYAKRS